MTGTSEFELFQKRLDALLGSRQSGHETDSAGGRIGEVSRIEPVGLVEQAGQAGQVDREEESPDGQVGHIDQTGFVGVLDGARFGDHVGGDSDGPGGGRSASDGGGQPWIGLGRASVLGLVAVVTIACAADLPPILTGSPKSATIAAKPQARVKPHDSRPKGAPFPSGEFSPNPGCPGSQPQGWVAAENKRIGTAAWQDARHIRAGSVNGYLSQASAACGNTVTAYLTSPTPVTAATVTAYRMGYYKGLGGHQVWEAKHVTITPQPALTATGPDLLLEAGWKPTLSIDVSADWTPGYYLLVVRAPGQSASSIPLVVRADGDRSPLAFQASVLTYQAYNTYGGHSAYSSANGTVAAAKVVSFDRPYEDGGYYSPYQYELPVIDEVERLGLDTDYLTDLDVDADPDLLLDHNGIITGGHSEYWTRRMYDGAVQARDNGVNIAFFGANAVYTAARLEPSPQGPARREVIRRTVNGDPVAAKDPADATVNWVAAPLNRPQSTLVGQGYGYVGASGSLRVLHPNSWIFAGTGVTAGEVLRNTVGGEYDQVDVNRPTTPVDIDVLAAMPMRFKNGQAGMATTTYYVATSQAGVFDAGTTYWPCVISGVCLHLGGEMSSTGRSALARMTDNILIAFAQGPAGLAHPSTPNLPPSPEALVQSAADPGDVAQRQF
jgi:hypothetical protein